MSIPHGTLLLIGGAEDKVGNRVILSRFVRLAGGSDARIAIVATASSFYDYVGQRYVELFTALGAAHVEILRVRDRQEAQESHAVAQFQQATGIFITGGDQLKLTAVLGGTLAARCIRERYTAGAVVGGTSAGASAAAEHMLAYGASGIPPRKGMMQFAPGLALISGVVIDQHFGARSRAGRLMTAVAHNPDLLGIGLDEDTAVEIDGAGRVTVIGRSSVMIVDGSALGYTDIHRIPQHAPLTIFGMTVHVLSHGYHYDIASRTPQLPTLLPPLPEETVEGVLGDGI